MDFSSYLKKNISWKYYKLITEIIIRIKNIFFLFKEFCENGWLRKDICGWAKFDRKGKIYEFIHSERCECDDGQECIQKGTHRRDLMHYYLCMEMTPQIPQNKVLPKKTDFAKKWILVLFAIYIIHLYVT